MVIVLPPSVEIGFERWLPILCSLIRPPSVVQLLQNPSLLLLSQILVRIDDTVRSTKLTTYQFIRRIPANASVKG